jgi:hypothetical protein
MNPQDATESSASVHCHRMFVEPSVFVSHSFQNLVCLFDLRLFCDLLDEFIDFVIKVA